jgi:transaldolase
LKFLRESNDESLLETIIEKFADIKDPSLLAKFIAVEIGKKILAVINGRVSIELDPRYSYDVQKTVEEAKFIIGLFDKEKIHKDRILIKIASTWQGTQAAKILQKDHGINCNMTLIFSRFQVKKM